MLANLHTSRYLMLFKCVHIFIEDATDIIYTIYYAYREICLDNVLIVIDTDQNSVWSFCSVPLK